MDLTGTDYKHWKSNAEGVDLNRNFPYNWSETVSATVNPAARYYPGPYAASEPETRAMMALLGTTDFSLLIDFHTYGEIIYWKDNGDFRLKTEMQPLVQKLFAATGYSEAGEADVRDFGGFLENYARNTHGKYAMTIELATETPYNPARFDEAVTDGVYQIGLIVADYMLQKQEGREANGKIASTE